MFILFNFPPDAVKLEASNSSTEVISSRKVLCWNQFQVIYEMNLFMCYQTASEY